MTQSFDSIYLIFFGIPGAGKGTVVTELSKEYKNIYHFAPGDLFREHKRKQTDFYKNKVAKYLDNGQLIPSETTNEMVGQKLEEIKKNKVVIFDGYPRKIDQMDYLEEFLSQKSRTSNSKIGIDVIFNIEIEKEIAKNRIVNRRICSSCGATLNFLKVKDLEKCPVCKQELVMTKRQDDSPELYERRYKWTMEEVFPVVKKYKELDSDKFINIETTEETQIEEIKEAILKELKRRNIILELNE